MEAVAEGLWALETTKCLEAICQSVVSFLPIIEIKTRLRVAALLLKRSHNVNHAKYHLERSVCWEIMVVQLQFSACKCPIIEGDYHGSVSALQQGLTIAVEMFYPELQKQHCLGLQFYHELLQLFYLLRICDYKTATQRMQHIRDLTNELEALNQTLSRSDLNYKERSALAEKQTNLEEQLNNYRGDTSTGKETLEPAYSGNVKRAWPEKLVLAPPPIDGEWLPKSAVYALVDLMVVIFSWPKGLFKECQKRIESGVQIIQVL